MALVKCAECSWNYPENMLNCMFVGDSYTKPICGICALELTNKLHGVKRNRFRGPMAEDFRLRSINWRKRHPEHKTKAN